MKRLHERVAIVTGASRGIGRAVALRLASEGAKVVLASRSEVDLRTVVAEVQGAGGVAMAAVCDVADAGQIEATVRDVAVDFGRIDILVNNAFDPSCVLSSVVELSADVLQRNFDMGPVAYLRMMQACYPYLKASGQGRIINFGSMAGLMGMPGYAPYAMAKEAVRALTRVAAREWGPDGITVNNVLPVADTWGAEVSGASPPPSALSRFGSPENDVAPVVAFLASDDARFLTGYSFNPDGGATIDAAR